MWIGRGLAGRTWSAFIRRLPRFAFKKFWPFAIRIRPWSGRGLSVCRRPLWFKVNRSSVRCRLWGVRTRRKSSIHSPFSSVGTVLNDSSSRATTWIGLNWTELDCENGDSDVGDIVMLVTLWWRPIWDVGAKIIMLTTFLLCWWFFQCIKSVANISNLSLTHLFSNIRH